MCIHSCSIIKRIAHYFVIILLPLSRVFRRINTVYCHIVSIISLSSNAIVYVASLSYYWIIPSIVTPPYQRPRYCSPCVHLFTVTQQHNVDVQTIMYNVLMRLHSVMTLVDCPCSNHSPFLRALLLAAAILFPVPAANSCSFLDFSSQNLCSCQCTIIDNSIYTLSMIPCIASRAMCSQWLSIPHI